MRKYIIILILCYGCDSKPSESSDTIIDNTANKVINSFFKNVETIEPSVAIDRLLRSNGYFILNDSSTLDLKQKFSVINELSGKYKGNRLLKRRLIGEDVGIYSYIVKYEKKF